MSLEGKKILITAGPTWVPIDNVRVISNIATGENGIRIANEAALKGASVTLVLGPCTDSDLCSAILKKIGFDKSFRLIRFCFFEELKTVLKSELENKKYDVIIHSAAVSDFRVRNSLDGKLISGKKHRLELVPLEKLIGLLRYLCPWSKLVMFKLESNVKEMTLIRRAKIARDKNRADYIVANQVYPYRAFIIDKYNNQIFVKTKKRLAIEIVKILNKSFNGNN